jgi:hypothetical protein
MSIVFPGSFTLRCQDDSERIYCAKQEIGDAISTHGQVAALVFHFVLDSGKLRMDHCLRSIPEISRRTSPSISALGYLSFSKYTQVRVRPGGN